MPRPVAIKQLIEKDVVFKRLRSKMNIKLINDSKTIEEANRILYKELFAPLQISETDIEKLKSDGKEQYVVCEIKGHIVGVIVIVEKDSEAELLHAVVASEYRSKGIGKILWRKALDHLKSKEYKDIFLYSRNTAFDFWSRCGFKAISDEWLEHELFIPHGIRHKRMKCFES